MHMEQMVKAAREAVPVAVGSVNPLARFGFGRVGAPTPLRDSTKMLLAISRTGKHLYEGTVPAHVKAKRRAKNKAARRARRVHRR